MALRGRTALANLGNQENAILKGKSSSIVAPLKRSALGEIGNKVNSVRGTTAFGKTSLLPDALKKTSKHVVAPRAQVKVIAKAEPPVVEVQPVQVAQVQPLPQAREAEPEKASFSSDLLVEDIDQDDAENPSLVSIYSNDIYSHLRDLERQTPIHEEFLTGQQVTPKMRSVLVDWLVEVHQQFHLTQESLYLTIAIIDRFLQAYKTIDRKRLQLVGITAMFIASKYEEMYSPDLNDFVYITDNAYTKGEVLHMEMLMLKTLNFSLGRPLPLQFLRRYSKAGKALAVHHTMAKYFLEQSLVHYEMCHHPPSLIAAAALYLSFYTIGDEQIDDESKNPIWTPTLAHYSKYKEDKILPVVKQIASIIATVDQSKHQAVRKKYTQSKHMKISLRSELKSPTLMKLATGPINEKEKRN